MASFEELRATFPKWGLAVYAYMPGEPVTLEVHIDGKTTTVVRPTLEACIDVLMPAREPPPQPTRVTSILD
jgi:hypothetical protein